MLKYFYRTLFFFVSGVLSAEYSITKIAERTGDLAFTQPTTPILGNGGIAYWHDYGSTNVDGGGELVLAFPGGVLAADPRTLSQAGDFPAGVPMDAQNGKLLVRGRYFEPIQPQGFAIHLQTGIGVNYRLEDSTNLVNWNTVTNFVGNGAVSTLTNLPSVGNQRFFRLVIP